MLFLSTEDGSKGGGTLANVAKAILRMQEKLCHRVAPCTAESDTRMREQPARSPDVNVLDLVVWRILEAKVHAREPKTKDELLQACVDAWNNDLRAEHLELAFRLLHVVRRQIIEKKGGNFYRKGGN